MPAQKIIEDTDPGTIAQIELAGKRINIEHADARTLACISMWPPAGSLVEEAYMAAQGEGAFSIDDARRLSRWSRRWAEVPDDLAIFYAAYDHEPVVHQCLWRIFGNYPGPDGRARVRLSELWREYAGYEPPFSLVWP